MILFKNQQNIEVFNSFIDQFENAINQNYDGNMITIVVMNEQHPFFKAIANDNDPFARNSMNIAINEQVCQQLKLTQDEKYAMIAHEIGHILDSTPKETNNQLSREHNADQFAVKLNLTIELKTGLEKLIESGNYPEENEGLKERIEKLSGKDLKKLNKKI
jgi:Zn-dependent protease with chaperone function